MARTLHTGDEPEVPRSVPPETGVKLIQKQIEKAEQLLAHRPLSSADHAAWDNVTRDYLVRAFGSRSPNVNEVVSAHSSVPLHLRSSDADFERSGASRLENQVTMLRGCVQQLETDIELAASGAEETRSRAAEPGPPHRVFIVHGRDAGAKDTVARVVERGGLEAVILHEQPSRGRTIIEKLSDHSNVGFAIVLITGDDVGGPEDGSEDLRPRARQNVVFELGYFIAKLGRARVCVLYEEGVELPTDYQGVVWIPLDADGAWRARVVQELRSAGLTADFDKMLGIDRGQRSS